MATKYLTDKQQKLISRLESDVSKKETEIKGMRQLLQQVKVGEISGEEFEHRMSKYGSFY